MCSMNSRPLTMVLVFLSAMATSTFSSANDWEFKLAPLFLWGISLDGEATLGSQAAPLELDFVDDVLENLDAVFTLHFEAKNDDLIFFAEYQYVKLAPTIAEGPLEADVEFKNTAAELGTGWEFFRSERIDWQMLVGLRYLDQEVDVDGSLNLPDPPLGPGPLPVGITGGDDWYHPFVGVRSSYQMTSRWNLLVRGDYGYSNSDNRALNLSFMFDYRYRDWGSAFVGYRYMDFDYSSGSGDELYAFDAEQQGPLLGFAFYW